MREGCGGFGAFLLGIVEKETARREAIGRKDHPHTGDPEGLPRPLGVAKPPGQGGQGIRAKAGTFEAHPTEGVGHQESGRTPCQPGTVESGETLARAVVLQGRVEGIDKGGHKGCGLSNNHRGPQAIAGAAIP
jgi:hypothetical protein